MLRTSPSHRDEIRKSYLSPLLLSFLVFEDSSSTRFFDFNESTTYSMERKDTTDSRGNISGARVDIARFKPA